MKFPAGIEVVAIDSVMVDPANANDHPDENIQVIRDSLRKFGMQTPLVVDARNVVLKGNGTLQAARLEGWTQVAIVRTSLADASAMAYAIVDNRSSELSKWNNKKLQANINAIRSEDDSLISFLGFSEQALRNMASGLDDDAEFYDVAGVEPPVLADGDRDPFQQMTFTLHDTQADTVKAAIDKAKAAGEFDGSPNENSNGNALARIAEAYYGTG